MSMFNFLSTEQNKTKTSKRSKPSSASSTQKRRKRSKQTIEEQYQNYDRDASDDECDEAEGHDAESNDESDDDDDDDEDDANVIDMRPKANDYVIYNDNQNGQNDALYRAVHGDNSDMKEYEKQFENYKKEDWDTLAETLFENNIDYNCTNQELFRTFYAFYNIFCHKYNDEYAVIERISSLYPNITTMDQQLIKIREKYSKLHLELTRRELLDPEDIAGREFLKKLTEISFCIKISFEQMVNYRLLKHASDPTVRSMLEGLTPLSFFKDIDISKLSKTQQLLHFYWRKAFNNNYRRDGDSLYKPKFNDDGEFLYYYEYVCEISDFIYNGIFPLNENHYWFECFTARSGTPSHCVNIITNLKTEWLPKLDRNPNVFSFHNGIYLVSLNQFFYYKQHAEKNWVGSLTGNLTAHKHFSFDFDDEGMENEMNLHSERTFMSIRLDPVYQILLTQGFTYEEIAWIFAFLGRMLFPVAELDSWAVFPYFIGMGGTGKSTLLRLVAALFEPRDVGHLNNSLQRTFALESIWDKRVYFGLDIDDHFQLDQATFQSMVCGEEVSILRKFKKPMTILWNIQGGFAGNKLPNWTDNGGSLSRRLIIIEFMQPITNCDPNLFTNCMQIRDRFLKVIVSAYLQMSERFRDRGIKEVMPKKFKDSEERLLKELNVLSSFILESCEIDPISRAIEKTKFVELSKFRNDFKTYCNQSNIKQPQWNATLTNTVFAKYQITLVKPHANVEDRFGQTKPYLLGCALKE